jgi:hypothetical protein
MAAMLKASSGFPEYRTGQIALKSPVKRAGVFSSEFQFQDEYYDDGRELEVDYDNKVTDLYRFISNSQWEDAYHAIQQNPIEAKTWVVRYNEDDKKGVMWRFLPIHSACARQPPEYIVRALINAYPTGTELCDDQGKYALHYAAANQASPAVIQLLTDAYPNAATTSDPEGKLPLHWMAIEGPLEVKAVQILTFATKKLVDIMDDDGYTPLDYAQTGTYMYRQETIAVLKGKNPFSTSKTHTPQTSKPVFEFSEGLTNIQTTPLNSSARSVVTTATRGEASVNKSVAKFKKQIVKLKAEIAYHQAEYEEKLVSEQEEHEEAIENLENEIDKTIEEIEKVKIDIRNKAQYIESTEKRISASSKEYEHFNELNMKLQNELSRAQDDFKLEKSKVDGFQMRIKSLMTMMSSLISSQEKIAASLLSLEEDNRKASEARRLKLQELMNDDMSDMKKTAEVNRVYGFGPSIHDALNEQKSLMSNCAAVLEECDYKDYDIEG